MKAQPVKATVAAKTTGAAVKAKPLAKSAMKAAVTASAKASAKPAVQSRGTQAAPTPVAKATPVKTAKPTAKVQEKDPVKMTIAKTSKPEAVPVKAKVTHTVKAGSIAAAAVPSKPVVAAPVQAESSSGVPARAGRPSSRLAQLTVPSMAQSVASTDAKASYSKVATAPLIVPPLASAVKRDPKLANNWKTKPVAELSDAEVIAMSDDDYMNDTQMAFFRLKLLVLKKDILNNAGETTEHLREDTVVVPDPADRATIEEEHALELRTRDRERKLLKKIEQSIGRIDSGDYGYCDETGEPIGVGRLLARPTANLSLEAQQRRELKQKMFGD